MLTEGKGLRPPAPVKIRLTPSEVSFLQNEAGRRDSFRRYRDRKDAWGRGYTDGPTFVGLVGEHAVCAFLSRRLGVYLKVDTALRRKGDGGADVFVFGLRLQVKTKKTGTKNLIRRLDHEKQLRGLFAHAFVFARWLENQRLVQLLGWIRARDVTEVGKFCKSTRDEHWNLDIEDHHLLPMNDLVDELVLRRAS